ncbi:MAG TPA: hypothetical protein VK513_09320 [Terriglobales bacterium]|jgi:hypothetical protein|nr:hypothetical protein [Terriglobales bacterium]
MHASPGVGVSGDQEKLGLNEKLMITEDFSAACRVSIDGHHRQVRSGVEKFPRSAHAKGVAPVSTIYDFYDGATLPNPDKFLRGSGVKSPPPAAVGAAT